jgi:adenylate cyclase class 2
MRTAGNEIEIKLPVQSLVLAKQRLRELRAARTGRLYEANAVFDTPEHALRRRGQLLRLRVERRAGRAGSSRGAGKHSARPGSRKARVAAMLFSQKPARKALVTVKVPVTRRKHSAAGQRRNARDGAYKIRREIEFTVPDAAALRTVLGFLGFQPVFYYEKYRTTYRLPGLTAVVVALDETPIGTFLELEGRPREIDRARRLLGYKTGDAVLASYGGLYAAHQHARGLPFGHMLFG